MFDWIKSFFKAKPKERMGIDIGSSAIKLVEIVPGAQALNLATYGLASFGDSARSYAVLSDGPPKRVAGKIEYGENGGAVDIMERESADQGEIIFRAGLPSNSILGAFSDREISQIIKELLVRSKAKARRVSFSLPAFTTFFTVMELPPMGEKEIHAAIPYEAAKYVPIPLEEVFLDWSIISPSTGSVGSPRAGSGQAPSPPVGGKATEDRSEGGVSVLMVAILKEAVAKYTKIARMSNLEMGALEPESFSLARVLVGESKDLLVVADIGFSFTNIALVDQGSIRIVYNTRKKNYPDLSPEAAAKRGAERLDVDAVVREINGVLNSYRTKGNVVENPRCILVGGRAQTPDLDKILKDKLNFEVSTLNPFEKIGYPKRLEPALNEISLSFGVAVGLAMRE
jgi:type IV pilus assembly protein PilM